MSDRKPCQTPDNCRKPKRGRCSCSFTAEERAHKAALFKDRKINPASIAKQLETKRKTGVNYIPPCLMSYYKKLSRNGISGDARRKAILEASK